MQNGIVENLKDLFRHSSEIVLITDYDFNILWNNRSEENSVFSETALSELFQKERLPLKSGEYTVRLRSQLITCRVINYPHSESGVYVIQTDGEDVMFSFIKRRGVKEFLMNQAGAVRQAVTGITFASNMLHKALDESDMYADHKYLDITMGNCYKLLKTASNTTELMRYDDGSIENKKIDVSAILEEIVKKCSEILGGSIEIRAEIQKDLYIKADMERFVACMLSLIILANDKNPENNIIILTAEKVMESVSITAKADRSGYSGSARVFSGISDLYDGDEVDSDLLVVKRFCNAFNGTLFISASAEDLKCLGMKFPYCDDTEPVAELSTFVRPYPEDKFTKYHIALSVIADVFYY